MISKPSLIDSMGAFSTDSLLWGAASILFRSPLSRPEIRVRQQPLIFVNLAFSLAPNIRPFLFLAFHLTICGPSSSSFLPGNQTHIQIQQACLFGMYPHTWDWRCICPNLVILYLFSGIKSKLIKRQRSSGREGNDCRYSNLTSLGISLLFERDRPDTP
jgi:hypothetical protein